VAAAVAPFGMWNIFVDFFVVLSKLSPMRPQLDVAPESYTAEFVFFVFSFSFVLLI